MFERFTERARKVMTISRQEAQRLNSEFIGTEHILLGLVVEGGGVAAKVLKQMKVEGAKIKQEVEKLITPSTSSSVTMGQLPFSPRAKRVFELATEAMFQLGNDVIGTEHLLLALLKENEGIAAQVLINLGLKLDEVRDMTLEILGSSVDTMTSAITPGDYLVTFSAGLSLKQIREVVSALKMIKGVEKVEKVASISKSIGVLHELLKQIADEVGVLKSEIVKKEAPPVEDDPPITPS